MLNHLILRISRINYLAISAAAAERINIPISQKFRARLQCMFVSLLLCPNHASFPKLYISLPQWAICGSTIFHTQSLSQPIRAWRAPTRQAQHLASGWDSLALAALRYPQIWAQMAPTYWVTLTVARTCTLCAAAQYATALAAQAVSQALHLAHILNLPTSPTIPMHIEATLTGRSTHPDRQLYLQRRGYSWAPFVHNDAAAKNDIQRNCILNTTACITQPLHLPQVSLPSHQASFSFHVPARGNKSGPSLFPP